MPKIVTSPALAPPRGYSNGLLYPAGQLLFVAGQIGWNRESQLVSQEFAPQFRQALENVASVVESAGGTPESIGRLTIYVTDKQRYLGELKDIGVAYRAVFGRHYPAMSLVEVADLLEDGALVEIEATAVI